LGDQERKLSFLETREQKRLAGPQGAEESATGVRFSARSVRAQRKRLRLSAEEYAKLIGVSAQTVYLWEHGKSRPRDAQLAALVKVHSLGRRETRARLEAIGAAEPRKPLKRRKKTRRPRARKS